MFATIFITEWLLVNGFITEWFLANGRWRTLWVTALAELSLAACAMGEFPLGGTIGGLSKSAFVFLPLNHVPLKGEVS